MLKFFILSPITWFILCLISFFLTRKKWLKKICLILTILIFLIFTNPALISYLEYKKISKYSESVLDTHKRYDVAVVMGGFSGIDKYSGRIVFVENRADRLWEAARLYKEGKVKRLLITGDPSTMMHEKGKTYKKEFFEYMNKFGLDSTAFIIEPLAKNTHENALYTKQVLDSLNISKDSVLLITSAIHMGRSIKCFRKEGLEPDLLPVGYVTPDFKWNVNMLYPSWKSAFKWEELLNELIGEMTYKVMGYI